MTSKFINRSPIHCSYVTNYGRICRKTKLNDAGYCKNHSKLQTKSHKIVQEVKKSSKHTFAVGFRSFSPEKTQRLDYHEYIASPEWIKKSGEEKKKNPKCSFCNRIRVLHVHHRTYVRLGNEIPGDLVVLCDECHKIFHQFYEYDGRTGHFVRSK